MLRKGNNHLPKTSTLTGVSSVKIASRGFGERRFKDIHEAVSVNFWQGAVDPRLTHVRRGAVAHGRGHSTTDALDLRAQPEKNASVPERGIPQPEPGLTPWHLVERARAMRDHLRVEQQSTEQRTHCSDETHKMFEQAGFHRMLQPRVFGGYEARIPDFYRLITETARGCPSTAWCLARGAAGVVNLAGLFGFDVQCEAMGVTGHFIAPLQVTPSGTARRVGAGWLVNGSWNHSSGAPRSTHTINAVEIEEPGGLVRAGLALLPASTCTVLDWRDSPGLRGSGPHTVRADDARLPEGWIVPVNLADIGPRDSLGWRVHGNPMYVGRYTGLAFGVLVAVGVGTARALFDEFISAWRLQEAQSSIDAADAVLVRVGDLYHELCNRFVHGSGEFSLEEDWRLAALALRANDLATGAVELLTRVIGSSRLRDESRVQRYWRDFSAYRSHITPLTKNLRIGVDRRPSRRG